VHCEAGVGRTGIMVASYRMAVQGWSTGHAVAEARRYGLRMREQIEYIRGLGRELADARSSR
jgi:protein tyrosine/serine phosphatase